MNHASTPAPYSHSLLKRLRIRGLGCWASLALTLQASAATQTWDGGSIFNNNWSTADNWTKGTAPVAGDGLVFPLIATASDKATVNDLTAGTDFTSLTFQANGYSVTGNSFDLMADGSIALDYASGTTQVSPLIRLLGTGLFSTTGGAPRLLTGAVNLNGGDLQLSGPGTIEIAGNIVNSVGSPTITKSDVGLTILGGFNNFTGNISVSGGTLRADGFLGGTGTISVSNTAALTGKDGGISKSTSINGTLAPGSAGDDTTTMDFQTLSFATSTFVFKRLELDIAGTAAGNTYDRLVVSSSLTLNSANLVLDFGSFLPPVGTVFTLINHTGASAIAGTFSGIAQGAQISRGGQLLQFSYTGGTGNDFTATVLNQAPVAASQSVSTNEDSPLSVTLSATDANPQTQTYSIVSNPGFGTLSGSGAIRTYTPNLNFNGSDSFTFRANDGTTNSNTATVSITVNPVNDAPTISNVADRTINGDSTTGAIAFTVGDVETAVASLTVTGTSSNQTLVPSANIVFGGIGANRSVTVRPAPNQFGTSTITLTVSDGTVTSSDTFLLTVDPVNDAPTISNVADRTIEEDSTTGAIPFTVGDVDTDLGLLTVTRFSRNLTLVPIENIVLGGSGANRTVTVTPAANQFGTVTITLNVNDGTTTTTDTFLLTVTPVNDAPTITDVPDRTINGMSPAGPIGFTVTDMIDPGSISALTVTSTSSNQTVIPDANIVLGGSGANRTVTLIPVANQFGTTTITLTVSDGMATTSDTFLITVIPSEVFTWDGGGANNSTATATNWQLDSTPDSNIIATEVVFTGNTRQTPQFPAPFSVYRMTFDAGAGAFSVSGSMLSIGQGGVAQLGPNLVTLDNAVSFASEGSSSIQSAGGGLLINGPITLPTFTLNVTGTAPVTFGPDADFTLGAGQVLVVGTDLNVESRVDARPTFNRSGTVEITAGKHLRLSIGGSIDGGSTATGSVSTPSLLIGASAQLTLAGGALFSLPTGTSTFDNGAASLTDSSFGIQKLILNNGATFTATNSTLRGYHLVGSAPLPGDPFNLDAGSRFSIGENGAGIMMLDNTACDGFANSYRFQFTVGTGGMLALSNGSTIQCRNFRNSGQTTLSSESSILVANDLTRPDEKGELTLLDGTIVLGTGCEIRCDGLSELGGAATGQGKLRLEGSSSPGLFESLTGRTTETFTTSCHLAFGTNHDLVMHIAGTSPGTQFDRIVCTGPTQFTRSGNLRIVLSGGFVPSSGQTFDLLDFDPMRTTGDFSSLQLPALPSGLVWDDSLLATQGFLKVNPPNALQSWRFLHFGSHSSYGISANDFDFDKDGISNLLEFAFGLNPKAPDAHLLPVSFVSGGNLVIGFSPPSSTGLTYGAESSTTLAPNHWTSLTNVGFGNLHLYQIPLSPGLQMFMRLRITEP